MSAVGGIEVPRQTSGLAMRTDIDRITYCAMKTGTDNIKETAYTEETVSAENFIDKEAYWAHFTPGCLSAKQIVNIVKNGTKINRYGHNSSRTSGIIWER